MAKLASRRRSVLEHPEEVLTLAQQLLTQLKQQWRWLVLAAALVAALALGLSIRAGMAARQEANASEAFFKVRSQVAGDEKVTAAGIKALDQFLQDYPHTGAAFEAELLRANALYQTKKFAEAAKAYEALAGRDPGMDLVIKDSLSYCYEAMGDYKKAAQVLKPLADQATGPFKGEFLRHLAMLYEQAKEPQEAAVYWHKLMEEALEPQLKPYLQEKLAAAEAQVKK
jgi:tetratricopeptide (TPR) repeat protein